MLKKIFLSLIAAIFIFGMSNLSFAMTCGGEAHKDHLQLAQAHTEHGATEAGKDAASERAVNVGNKICPVSGEKIDEKTKANYEYQGKIYNFCCVACIEDFKKDPQKYIKKVEEELEAEPKEAGGHEEHKTATMQEPEAMHQGMHEGHHH